MKTSYIPWIIIIGLLFALWFVGCNREKPEVITVEVPAVSGEFPEQEPVYIDRTDTIYITKWKEIKVPTPNPINKDLANNYQQAKDSLERFKLYLDAISIRTFSNTFTDEYLDLTVTGQVEGNLLWVKPEYTILPRSIEIEKPRPPMRILLGGELGNNTELTGFRYKATLGLQNRSGDMFTVGYGDGGAIWVGYYRSLVRF